VAAIKQNFYENAACSCISNLRHVTEVLEYAREHDTEPLLLHVQRRFVISAGCGCGGNRLAAFSSRFWGVETFLL